MLNCILYTTRHLSMLLRNAKGTINVNKDNRQGKNTILVVVYHLLKGAKKLIIWTVKDS